MHPLIAFGHRQSLVLEVEVRRSEREHLPKPKAAPVKQFEGNERLRLVHDLAAEAQVLFLCPEAHLFGLLASDLANLHHRVRVEPVVAHRMIEHGGELVADRVQIGLRLFKHIARPHGLELIFPIENVERGDLIQALMT